MMLWTTVFLAVALGVALSILWGAARATSKIVRGVLAMLDGQWWTTRRLKDELRGEPYNVLQMLERAGVVESRVDGNMPLSGRRLYRLKYRGPGQ